MQFYLLYPITNLISLNRSRTGDFVDKLNHSYTVLLLVCYAIFVSAGQFVGDPIHCWGPAEWTGEYETYFKTTCWVKNTYYVPIVEGFPVDSKTKLDREITFYQWVPLLLLIQAFLFKLPHLIWRVTSPLAGLNLNKLCRAAEEIRHTEVVAHRFKKIQHMAEFLERWIINNRPYKFGCCDQCLSKTTCFCWFLCSRRTGTYFTGLYLSVKLLTLGNIFIQFCIVNSFMSENYFMYGFKYMEMWTTKTAMVENPRFPKTTFCDVDIREINNELRRWTLQCVLAVNLFNEVIFVSMWFWMAGLGIFTAISLIKWLYVIGYRGNNYKFVKRHLMLVDTIPTKADRKLCRGFAEKFLRNDGCFVARIVEMNSDAMIATDLLDCLFQLHVAEEYAIRKFKEYDVTIDVSYTDDEEKLMLSNGFGSDGSMNTETT